MFDIVRVPSGPESFCLGPAVDAIILLEHREGQEANPSQIVGRIAASYLAVIFPEGHV